ncbi:MAG: hypothetical protein AAF636_23955 [Pseudomonadota bacterium]
MAEQLTEDQQKRISATLKRIRAGLDRAVNDPFAEPGHTFDPEAQNAKQK